MRTVAVLTDHLLNIVCSIGIRLENGQRIHLGTTTHVEIAYGGKTRFSSIVGIFIQP